MHLFRAVSLRKAIETYLTGDCRGVAGLTICPDGSITVPDGNKLEIYPNMLSCIETNCKAYEGVEWQIRQIPDWAFEVREVELFCGEDSSDIEAHIKSCRPYLRRDHPRSRAKAFVWYLNDGCLTTFYNRRKYAPIEILGRYFERKSDEIGVPYASVVKWEGTDEDILNQLHLWPESYREPMKGS